MNEMIDRVAQAICVADDELWDELGETAADQAPFGYSREWYRAFARAALAAMREPTEAMVDAGGNCGGFEFDGESGMIYPKPIWRAMIDECLK